LANNRGTSDRAEHGVGKSDASQSDRNAASLSQHGQRARFKRRNGNPASNCHEQDVPCVQQDRNG
jgi:hypothetical protein